MIRHPSQILVKDHPGRQVCPPKKDIDTNTARGNWRKSRSPLAPTSGCRENGRAAASDRSSGCAPLSRRCNWASARARSSSRFPTGPPGIRTCLVPQPDPPRSALASRSSPIDSWLKALVGKASTSGTRVRIRAQISSALAPGSAIRVFRAIENTSTLRHARREIERRCVRTPYCPSYQTTNCP